MMGKPSPFNFLISWLVHRVAVESDDESVAELLGLVQEVDVSGVF
jgi:hypothetical protein